MSDFDLYPGQGCRCGNDPACFNCGSGPAYQAQIEQEEHYRQEMERQYSEELAREMEAQERAQIVRQSDGV